MYIILVYLIAFKITPIRIIGFSRLDCEYESPATAGHAPEPFSPYTICHYII